MTLGVGDQSLMDFRHTGSQRVSHKPSWRRTSPTSYTLEIKNMFGKYSHILRLSCDWIFEYCISFDSMLGLCQIFVIGPSVDLVQV